MHWTKKDEPKVFCPLTKNDSNHDKVVCSVAAKVCKAHISNIKSNIEV